MTRPPVPTDPRIPSADAHKIDAGEHIGSNPSIEPSIGALIERRLSRRDTMRGLFATGPWLHDGRAETVEAAVVAHGVALPADELGDLVQYLLER